MRVAAQLLCPLALGLALSACKYEPLGRCDYYQACESEEGDE